MSAGMMIGCFDGGLCLFFVQEHLNGLNGSKFSMKCLPFSSRCCSVFCFLLEV